MITRWRWPIFEVMRWKYVRLKYKIQDRNFWFAYLGFSFIFGGIVAIIACGLSAIAGWTAGGDGWNPNAIQFWSSHSVRPGAWIILAGCTPLILGLVGLLLMAVISLVICIVILVIKTVRGFIPFLKLFVPVKERHPLRKDLRETEDAILHRETQ